MDLHAIVVSNLRYAIWWAGSPGELVNRAEAGSEKYFDHIIKGVQRATDRNPRKVGPKVAAAIERAMQKPAGWMYQPHPLEWANAGLAVPDDISVPETSQAPSVSDLTNGVRLMRQVEASIKRQLHPDAFAELTVTAAGLFSELRHEATEEDRQRFRSMIVKIVTNLQKSEANI